MSEFLDMGGYARYVWSAFGITLVVLVGNYFVARSELRNIQGRLIRRLQAQDGSVSER